MKISNLFNFLKTVNTEVGKVIWPKKQEVIAATVFVVILAIIASLFFFAVDCACIYIIGNIL